MCGPGTQALGRVVLLRRHPRFVSYFGSRPSGSPLGRSGAPRRQSEGGGRWNSGDRLEDPPLHLRKLRHGEERQPSRSECSLFLTMASASSPHRKLLHSVIFSPFQTPSPIPHHTSSQFIACASISVGILGGAALSGVRVAVPAHGLRQTPRRTRQPLAAACLR